MFSAIIQLWGKVDLFSSKIVGGLFLQDSNQANVEDFKHCCQKIKLKGICDYFDPRTLCEYMRF